MLSKDKKKEKTNGDEGDKKDKKEKTNGSDSDSSGEECGTVRTHRITTTLRPRITGFTPSPRHSTTSQPVCLYFAYNFYIKKMSLLTRKPVQPQKLGRGLKFRA